MIDSNVVKELHEHLEPGAPNQLIVKFTISIIWDIILVIIETGSIVL